jgi:hypothetical protein
MSIKGQVNRCVKCILPETYPGINLDESGICNLCHSHSGEKSQRRNLDELFALCGKIKSDSTGSSYDCIVALSGGKDSTYCLKMMVERFSMRCLAITIDNGFLSPAVPKNVRTICDALGVDHLQFRPPSPFMKKVYQKSLDGSLQTKAAIKRASAVCNSCINIINTHMINTANRYDIPLIVGGYLGGQLPKGVVVMKVNTKLLSHTRTRGDAKYAESLGVEGKRYFSIDSSDDAMNMKQLFIANPIVGIDYDENDVIAEISALGWQRPKDTGVHSSNCLLNDFGIFDHYARYQFHPYEAELAELVRTGQMSRSVALEKVVAVPTAEDVRDVSDKLGIKLNENG